MLGLKRFRSASITIAGIELIHRSRKVSSNSEGFASKTTRRQRPGIQFSPPELTQAQERSIESIAKYAS